MLYRSTTIAFHYWAAKARPIQRNHWFPIPFNQCSSCCSSGWDRLVWELVLRNEGEKWLKVIIFVSFLLCFPWFFIGESSVICMRKKYIYLLELMCFFVFITFIIYSLLCFSPFWFDVIAVNCTKRKKWFWSVISNWGMLVIILNWDG